MGVLELPHRPQLLEHVAALPRRPNRPALSSPAARYASASQRLDSASSQRAPLAAKPSRARVSASTARDASPRASAARPSRRSACSGRASTEGAARRTPAPRRACFRRGPSAPGPAITSQRASSRVGIASVHAISSLFAEPSERLRRGALVGRDPGQPRNLPHRGGMPAGSSRACATRRSGVRIAPRAVRVGARRSSEPSRGSTPPSRNVCWPASRRGNGDRRAPRPSPRA